ncbi:hypothetical protein BJX96DRAFT_151907 [Aspergillus floccosus]
MTIPPPVPPESLRGDSVTALLTVPPPCPGGNLPRHLCLWPITGPGWITSLETHENRIRDFKELFRRIVDPTEYRPTAV